MASTVPNGNDRSEKWQRPFTKGKFASGSTMQRYLEGARAHGLADSSSGMRRM